VADARVVPAAVDNLAIQEVPLTASIAYNPSDSELLVVLERITT
jgi:hypothetical protein